MESLDAKLAYRAMFCFLEKYYELTQADEVGALLGSMSLLEDGMPADSAIWNEWLEAVHRALDPDVAFIDTSFVKIVER